MRAATRISSLLLLLSVVSLGLIGCERQQVPDVVRFHPSETHTVTISGMAPGFEYPETVRVHRGDTVRWMVELRHNGWEVDLGPKGPAYDRWLPAGARTSMLQTVIRLGAPADSYKYAFSVVLGDSIYRVDPIIIVEDD